MAYLPSNASTAQRRFRPEQMFERHQHDAMPSAAHPIGCSPSAYDASVTTQVSEVYRTVVQLECVKVKTGGPNKIPSRRLRKWTAGR